MEFEIPKDNEIEAPNWLAENYSMGNVDGPSLNLHVERLEDGGALLFLVAKDGSHHRFSRALADYAAYRDGTY